MAERTVELGADAMRLAHSLVGTSLPEAMKFCRSFDSADIDLWLSGTSTGTHLTQDGYSLIAGCAAAFAGATCALGSPSRADTTALLPRQVAHLPAAWSGFLPSQGQWLSIAVSDEHERDTALRCLNFLGAGGAIPGRLHDCTLSPSALASTLQEWGIASLPVSTSSGQIVNTTNRITASVPPPVWPGFRGSRALAGARVVDCGQLISAPWASALLTLLGACVIAVAPPGRAQNRRYGASPLQLDLNSKSDRKHFASLCSGADLVLDNFRPRVWSNLGIEPLELGAHCHLRLPAFPSVDPRSNFKCYGFQIEAMFAAGHVPAKDCDEPVPAPSHGLLDHAAGFAGAAVAATAIAGGIRGSKEVSHLSLVQRAKGLPA